MQNPHRQADASDQDSRGNSVLHTLVVIADDTTDNTDMIAGIYDQILIQHFKSEAGAAQLEAMENKQGLTPLKLAAKLGKIGVGLISATRFSFRAKPRTECAAASANPRVTSEAPFCRVCCWGWWIPKGGFIPRLLGSGSAPIGCSVTVVTFVASSHAVMFVLSHPFPGSCFGTSCTGNSQMKG